MQAILEQDKSIEMAAARKPGNDLEAEPFIQEEEEEKLHKGMGWKRAAFTMMAEIVGTGVLGLISCGGQSGGGLALAFLVASASHPYFLHCSWQRVRREHPRSTASRRAPICSAASSPTFDRTLHQHVVVVPCSPTTSWRRRMPSV